MFYVWAAVNKKRREKLCFDLCRCLWLTVRGRTRLLILLATLMDTCGQCTWRTGRRWRACCLELVSVQSKTPCVQYLTSKMMINNATIINVAHVLVLNNDINDIYMINICFFQYFWMDWSQRKSCWLLCVKMFVRKWKGSGVSSC